MNDAALSTSMSGPVSNKPFAWSWSRLKSYETCPKRCYEVDIAKNWQDDDSEFLVWGNEVHKAAELAIKENKPLPVGMPSLQWWIDKLKSVPYDKLLVEQKLAITKDFLPSGYFDKHVWFRTKADVLGITGPVALALDYKTGKLIEDNQQLALMAAAVFANFPSIQRIRTEFVWLKEGPDVSTREDFARSDMVHMWKNIWPRIEQLEHAYNTSNFPAKPGGLCHRWCVVKSCPHNGLTSGGNGV